MAKMIMIQAVNDALRTALRHDPSVVIMGEDVGVNGGVFRATDGLQKEFGERRVFDTPLAESGIVGTGIGMAAYGLRPVIEMQFEGFLAPAHENLVNHVARIRNRSRGRFTCPMVIRLPAFGGIRALEHHSESIEGWYANVPGLKLICPSGPYDAKGLLLSAIADPDPVLFFEPKRLYRSFREEVPEDYYTIPLGKAKVVREGKNVSLITYGSHVPTALDAAERAQAELGLSVEVIDLRSLVPLDLETIVASVNKTGRAVILNEAPRTNSFASELAAQIAEHCFLHLEAPIGRVTGFDTPMPYLLNEDLYLPNPERVLAALEEVKTF